MNPYHLINASSIVGVGLVGAGTYLTFGLGWSLMVSGGLVLAVTMYALWRLDRP